MGKLALDRHRQRMILDEFYQRARDHIYSSKHIERIDCRKYSGFSHLKKILDDYIPLEETNIKIIDTINKVTASISGGVSLVLRYQQAPLSIFEIIPWLIIIPAFFSLRSRRRDFDKIMEVYDETLYYEPLGENILV